MGDHRASIKIEFNMHGVERKCDMWVNYFPEERGVGEQVFAFFEEAYNAAMDAWDAEISAYENKKELEQDRKERAEYERLKKKFESGG